MRTMPRPLPWLCLLPLCACDASAGPSLSWSVRFANAQTAAAASSVEVAILEGSCSSQAQVYSALITRDATGSAPPRLKPGNYALLARATSEACSLIAYGCVQTSLPAKSMETIEIVLDDVPPQPFCGGECSTACDADDAGQGANDGGAQTSDGKVPDPVPQDGSTPPGDAGESPLDDGGDTPAEEAGVDVDADLPCDGKRGPNGHCYRFNAATLTFDAAEGDCIDWGGNLVSFNDAAEELWVTEEAAARGDFGSPVRFWIGFTDGATEGTWRWTDDSTPTSQITFNLADPSNTRFKTAQSTPYTHWGPNPQTNGNSEPNNGNANDPTQTPGEDCAESRADRNSGPGGITARPEWDDSNCANLKRSVCERE